MASALDIKIRALIEGMDDILRLRTGLGGIGEGAGAAGEGVAKLEGPLDLLKNNAGKLAVAFTALVAAYGIKESADYAARTEVLGTTLGVAAKNAGYSTEQMAGYEKEVKGLGITTQGTREALTQMIQAGLEIGPAAAGQVSQVAQLARAAQDLAVVTGESSSQTLTRLITNIAQMDTEGLRYMGLTVNIQAAQESFALSIGKTSAQLTQQQKIQAVTNAALEQAGTLAGTYEASMQNVGKQLGSLSRYQEELANSIGEKLLPAYFELVKAATDFLKVAENTVKESDKSGQGAKDLAQGVKGFFTGLSELFNVVLKIGADILPTVELVVGMFLDLAGDVLKGVAAFLQLGDTVDATGNKTSALGQAIKDTVIIPLGMLIAGLKDGFTFIGAMLTGLTGAVLDFAGTFLQSLGKVVGYFNSDMGRAIAGAGDSLRDTAKDLIGFADDTVAKFARGETALGKFNAKLVESQAFTQALAKASTYTDIEEQIRKLTEAKRKSTLSDVELKKGADEVALAITRMGGTLDSTTGKTQLSEEQVRKLNNSLLNITKDSVKQFSESINDMGLKLVKFGAADYLVPLNKEFDKLSGDVIKLADNAATTSLQFRQAFSKGLDSAKTLADIDAIAASLVNAKNANKDLGDSAQQVASKFEKVFAAALKAAKTKDDFALLEAGLLQLEKQGVLSGGRVSLALQQIDEAAKIAFQGIKDLGQQAVDKAQEAVNVSRAHLDIVRADADVGRARIGVWQAQNKYAREGTDLAAQELKYAQLNLTLAQAKAKEAQLRYAQEQQAMTVLIAQQELLNAKKRAGRDDSDAAAKAAVIAAEKEVEGATEAFNITKKKALAQQEVVLKTEEQLIKQKLVVEEARASADEARRFSDHTRDAAGHAGTLSTRTGDVTKGMMSASGAAGTLADNLGRAADQQFRLSQAQSLGDGGTARRNADVKSNTGEKKTYSDRPMDGYTISAEENRYWDYKEGKSGLTSADASYIKSEWAAAQANMQTMQANNAYFSQSGVDSVTKKYNEARRAMEALGLATGDSAGLRGAGDTGSGGFSAPGSGSGGFAEMSNQLLDQIKASSPVSIPSSTVQSIASQAPSKTIQVNFTNDSGQSVPVTVDAGNEGALLALLQKAKGVSA